MVDPICVPMHASMFVHIQSIEARKFKCWLHTCNNTFSSVCARVFTDMSIKRMWAFQVAIVFRTIV